MLRRYATQLPQRILQTLGQALERLRKADGARLPVRKDQGEVIEEMVEGLAGDRHAQLLHVREVTLALAPRWMFLRKVNFSFWTSQRSPTLHTALQRAQLTHLKVIRMLPT